MTSPAASGSEPQRTARPEVASSPEYGRRARPAGAAAWTRSRTGTRSVLLGLLLLLGILPGPASTAAETAPPRVRRILYNLDGDSCMTLIAGRKGPGPITTNDLSRIVSEITAPGSQVDTLLVCINAQVQYFPTRVGTLRGTLSTPEEKTRWGAHERQRFETVASFHNAGLDPYAYLLAEARRKGLETLLTFRMNDAHGNDFLRTAFWQDHPEFRLPGGALDFSHAAVRDHVFSLIEEAVRRYDADGLELDFQRFPNFFPRDSREPVGQRIAWTSELVERVRKLLNEVGAQRGRRLLLTARVPSDQGQASPTYEQCLAHGCDPAVWARRGWLDFLTVSEWLFASETLGLKAWRERIPGLPLYAGIQPESRPSRSDRLAEFHLGESGYRRLARERWADGADGIYLFNFFTTREWPVPFEPPFAVLRQIGSRETLEQTPIAPWETNPPIATVTAEIHRAHPAPRTAAMTAVQYVGPKLERREWQANESRDDVADEQRARWSTDNGRTWSEWIPQQPSSLVDYQGTQVWEGGWADTPDPTSRLLVQAWLRQIQIGRIYHCFTYVRTSADLGRTWSAPQQLRYEPGPDFDPNAPTNSAFLDRNEGYPGTSMTRLADGTLVLALAHANAPGDPRNNERPWRMGSVLFLGRWNVGESRYDWRPGARTEITPSRSARGLMEPDAAPLRDGRLLVVWRGSDEGWDGTRATEPGRKWHALSSDGGRTLGPVEPWRYADGGEFHSPSSLHRLHRHGVTGRLYWFGNLSLEAPRGNHPRFPLVIAEVDEVTGCLRRETVTVLADRRPYHGPDIQFSNFSLLEDRQSHDYELHLTTYGQEPDRADWATADSWKYTVRLLPRTTDSKGRSAVENAR